MTDDEARKLATRVIDTWPGGTRAYVWRDYFRHLDPNIAANTYRTLAATADRAPSVAQFRHLYGRLVAQDEEKRFGGHTTDYAGPVISRDEYLALLTERAEHNPDAADELEVWQRWLDNPKNRKAA